MKSTEINSREYWDSRFRGDWVDNHGPDQSRFFSGFALELFPYWLIREIRVKKLSIADWGCAQGDGTDALRQYFPAEQLTGIDFSQEAIDRARALYQDINFKSDDWLIDDSPAPREQYDVVYSSNTLEHFSDPHKVLSLLCQHASKAIVLVLPYDEDPDNRIDEHLYTFTTSNIPYSLPNDFTLAWSQVVDCREMDNSFYKGKQIMLVYISPEWRNHLDLCIDDCVLEKDNLVSEENIPALSQNLSNHDVNPLTVFGLSFLKIIYKLLPTFIRMNRKFIRIRNIKFGIDDPYKNGIENRGDISWKEFNQTVLSKRDNYKGIFILEPTIDWTHTLFQRPQQMAIAMGELNYLVIYKSGSKRSMDVFGFRNVAPNVWITNQWNKINRITDAVRSIYSTCLPSNVLSFEQLKKRGKLIYEYVDHIHPDIFDEKNLQKLVAMKNMAFSGGVDYVLTTSSILYDEAVKKIGEDKVILSPNGVNVLHFRKRKGKQIPIQGKLLNFRKLRPIIGYFGAIAPWLWYEMIDELARLRPDLGFVFIGPDYKNMENQLPTYNNVLNLGPVDYTSLPAYGNQFDVCFIPFRPGIIAQTTSPVKLIEYFALEKPVVVTSDMLECTAYHEVLSGDSASSLSQALDEAIKLKDDDGFKARLAQLADENSWIKRAEEVDKMLWDVDLQ